MGTVPLVWRAETTYFGGLGLLKISGTRAYEFRPAFCLHDKNPEFHAQKMGPPAKILECRAKNYCRVNGPLVPINIGRVSQFAWFNKFILDIFVWVQMGTIPIK